MLVVKADNISNLSTIQPKASLIHNTGDATDRLTPAIPQDRVAMLTTSDNPFNPFNEFDDWFSFDRSKGYFTCEYLARIAKTSNELSDEDNQLEIQRAIDEICKLNVLGIYKKIYKELSLIHI